MDLREHVYGECLDLHARAREVFRAGWPEFAFHDAAAGRYLPRIRECFGDLELLLLDAGDGIAAGGWGVPVRWDGTVADLPAGFGGALARAVALHDEGGTADTLVICAAQVAEVLRGKGIAARILTALIEAGERRGLTRVIAPVRPTLKASYPLTPIERYTSWTRPDGAPFDPWLRTHHRMGARIVAVAHRSMVITGTVRDWESWTGLALPDSGEYVVPGGLVPVVIDREADTGEMAEPNVWVRHR